MIAKYKYLLLCLAFLTACTPPAAPKKTADIPAWVIPENKMIEILTDVHIIEGARIGKKVLGDSLYAIDHYTNLWEKHNIRESQYDSSFRFYSRNADKMDLLYEEVITNISTLSGTAEGEQANGAEELEKAKAEKIDSSAVSNDSIDTKAQNDTLKAPAGKKTPNQKSTFQSE